MKGRGPEGGHLWLALPSTLILQMALQVFSPRVPIWRGGLAPTAGHRLSFPPYLASVCRTRPDTAGRSRRWPSRAASVCVAHLTSGQP